MGNGAVAQQETRRHLVAIFGAGGGLGRALIRELLARDSSVHILAVSRQPRPDDLSDPRLDWQRLTGADDELGTLAAYQQLCADWQSRELQLTGVISTIGWLHQRNEQGKDWQPERRIEQLSAEQLQSYFLINATLPALLLQSVKPLWAKQTPTYFVQLGAKVGSISDNHLGGWYGYRASKAALNMLFKTAAIEFKRTHKQLTLAVIHPGTTDTELSKPFQQRLPADQLYSAERSATRIFDVIANLTPEHSGSFYFWDGKKLPY